MANMQSLWALLTPTQIKLTYLLLALSIVFWFISLRKRKKIDLGRAGFLTLTCFLFISLLIHIGEIKDVEDITSASKEAVLEVVNKTYSEASDTEN